ncbi:MAG: hypothetical protein A3F14_00795 [Gammaproteobacteria bacterium RIFCSPHIGHO2_12_FULL_43_28]|nr:MAG: hypothetical protein A3F14_00795 [Gammaproteobacteria bacterium RIFCSPHIGHO2_12_FULL_43_28]
MWELFSIIGISSIALLVILIYRKKQTQTRRFTDKIQSNEIKLAASEASELRLRGEMQVLEAKLQDALLDPVTGLKDRSVFLERFQLVLRESERYQLTLGLLVLEIDNFKMINDALSYEVGDPLLKEVARRLEKCIRQVDSVVRFSNATFAILLSQLSKPETAAVVAARILQALIEPFYINGQELYLTACVGVAIFPADGQDIKALFMAADQALQLAKEKGKHSYQFSQEKIHQDSKRELALHTAINRDSLYQELVTFYQPIIDVTKGTIVCMDAKLCWQHPELGLIDAEAFSSYAAKQGKANQLTEWLLKNACGQFNRWHTAGFAPAFLGIPVSVRQIENISFIYRLSQILQELPFKPENLLLEIKGGDALPSREILEKSFNMLNYMGVKLLIENVGVGPFSFAELKLLTVHYLRLDSHLVDDIDSNQRTLALMKALLVLADAMSLQLIAQDVESETQKKILQDMSCSLMQGKLLGAPLKEQEVIEKMIVTTQ